MTNFINKDKVKEITNQDVINELSLLGITVIEVKVIDNKVEHLKVLETTRDIEIISKYPELKKSVDV